MSRRPGHRLGSALIHGLGALEARRPLRSAPRFPPLFVIGPPRTGTTLLGQVITFALDVAYIPSIVIQLCTARARPPIVVGTRLARLFGAIGKRGAFESSYGAASGAGESADSDFIWRYVISDTPLGPGDLEDWQRRILVNAVSGIEQVFGRPFVDKSVGHSIRIPALAALFPGAMFVRTRRNPLAVAQSVLIGRSLSEETRRVWPTPKARGWKELSRKDLLDQAVEQQLLFEREIDRGLRTVARERTLEVRYADLCRQPQRELERVMALMTAGGAAAKQVQRLPGRFTLSNTRRVDRELYERLVARVVDVYEAGWEPLEEPRPAATDAA